MAEILQIPRKTQSNQSINRVALTLLYKTINVYAYKNDLTLNSNNTYKDVWKC